MYLLILLLSCSEPLVLNLKPGADEYAQVEMNFEIKGLKGQESITIEIADICNQHILPDFDTCEIKHIKRPFPTEDNLSFILSREQFGLEIGKPMWIRVRQGEERFSAPVYIAFSTDPCSLFRTFIEAFVGGRCDPGLRQAVGKLRDRQVWQDKDFEVVVFDWEHRREVVLPKTEGTTGLYWLDDDHLLLAIKKHLRNGVYRYSLEQGNSKPYASSRIYRAPFQLAGKAGYIQWVEKDRSWQLHHDRNVVVLPAILDQILAVNEAAGEVLALSYDELSREPNLYVINPSKGSLVNLGFAEVVLNSARMRPNGEAVLFQAIGFEDSSSWIEVLQPGEKVLVGKGRSMHAILPAWSPSGKKFAYLRYKPE